MSVASQAAKAISIKPEANIETAPSKETRRPAGVSRDTLRETIRKNVMAWTRLDQAIVKFHQPRRML